MQKRWEKYACVACYTTYSLFQYRSVIFKLVRTRSITKRQFYERKAVVWLGPDLYHLSEDVAKKLKPDVLFAVLNMAFTLLMAFVAFRVFAIPLLEQRALLH